MRECEGDILKAPNAAAHCMEPPRSSPNAPSLCTPFQANLFVVKVHDDMADSVKEDVSDGDTAKRVFCSPEHQEIMVKMVEAHLCAHPLIPGHPYPSAAGIQE